VVLKDLSLIRKLEVPIIVRVGQKAMKAGDVLSLIPGTIIELPKRADDELELLVNNRPIGTGTAVKVGENFGFKIAFIGDVRERIEAMGARKAADAQTVKADAEAEALAEKLLAGQV
jgi:flagellar motor switch protein FliN/FliY